MNISPKSLETMDMQKKIANCHPYKLGGRAVGLMRMILTSECHGFNNRVRIKVSAALHGATDSNTDCGIARPCVRLDECTENPTSSCRPERARAWLHGCRKGAVPMHGGALGHYTMIMPMTSAPGQIQRGCLLGRTHCCTHEENNSSE